MAWLELRARSTTSRSYAELNAGEQARLQAELRPLIRANTFDAGSGRIVVSAERAQAIAQVAAHYTSLFSDDPATHKLREGYAMREDTVPDAAHRRALGAFFFWTSWAAVTQRPDEALSPPGRPKGEDRSAQHEGTSVSPPGRPKGEYRSAQHEGTPVSPPGRPKGECSRLAGWREAPRVPQ